MSLFSSAKKKRIVAILDIGSASVGGALVAFDKDGVAPTILFAVRKEMVFQQDLNIERFLSSMLDTLKSVLSVLDGAKYGRPKSVSCFLSSPWYESETKIFQIKNDKAFQVTEKLVNELVLKESESFHTKIGESKKIKEGVEAINTENIQMKLNGYETSHPYGKHARRVDAAFFVALASHKTLEMIRASIMKTWGIKDVAFNAFSLAAFSTIRDIFTNKDNFLLLDITGEVTDIALVRGDVLLETRAFPLGKNFLIRRLASELNMPPDGVSSLIRMATTDAIDDASRERLGSAMANTRKEWLESFTKELTALSGRYAVIPGTVFFTADNDVARWFLDVIKMEEFAQFTLTDNPFDVIFLDASVLGKFCMFSDDTARDPFLTIEAIFAWRRFAV